jgi:hypothetical protein
MELTVVRRGDRRRMVVSVDVRSEAEALRRIESAVGPVTVATEQLQPPRMPAGRRPRHARASAYF